MGKDVTEVLMLLARHHPCGHLKAPRHQVLDELLGLGFTRPKLPLRHSFPSPSCLLPPSSGPDDSYFLVYLL